ncbi:MAG: hypothetical protein Q8L04_06145 [Ignavibacteria bacterium]|nr:hypothetical protein [Ignavibacteria bacterium]
MKPEIRLQLVKEYNRLEKSSKSNIHFGYMVGVVLSLLYFTLKIADGEIGKFVYLFLIGLVLLYQIYGFVTHIFERKLSLLLSALLDKTEEPIQKEKVEINGTN